MRAFDRQVADAIWETVSDLIPPPQTRTKRGRPRADDRIVFHAILIRLVTGCSWVDAEAICGWQVSDTTIRARRNEWTHAGVFTKLFNQAVAAYDRIIGLRLEEVSIDGSVHKAPCGGVGTGPNPTDRAKSGHKWSVGTDRAGIPIGWALDGANRHDIKLLEPTLDTIAATGLHLDIDTIHLDRGYDAASTPDTLAAYGIDDAVIARKRRPGEPKPPAAEPRKLDLGMRWAVERTNSWLSNYGQLRRNTDRHNIHRHHQMCLAAAILITAKLVDYANRWSPPT